MSRRANLVVVALIGQGAPVGERTCFLASDSTFKERTKREFEKAETLLRQVLESDDRFADVHDMLGVIAHSRGNFIAAEKHFERALAINPSYTEAALILLLPWPGMLTHESRGKPRMVARCALRLMPTRWIESDSDPFTFWPGCAPLPITRMNRGRLPWRAGT